MSNAFRDLAKRREQTLPPPPSDRCHADNCPCVGSMSLEGGKFCCAAHAFSPSDRWPAITGKLRDNQWLIAFTDDIARIERERNAKVPDWRAYAAQFWTGIDDYCLPDAQEEFLPYQNRMRGELLYRCGLMKRPAPRLPKPATSRGNAAGFLGRTVA